MGITKCRYAILLETKDGERVYYEEFEDEDIVLARFKEELLKLGGGTVGGGFDFVKSGYHHRDATNGEFFLYLRSEWR